MRLLFAVTFFAVFAFCPLLTSTTQAAGKNVTATGQTSTGQANAGQAAKFWPGSRASSLIEQNWAKLSAEAQKKLEAASIELAQLEKASAKTPNDDAIWAKFGYILHQQANTLWLEDGQENWTQARNELLRESAAMQAKAIKLVPARIHTALGCMIVYMELADNQRERKDKEQVLSQALDAFNAAYGTDITRIKPELLDTWHKLVRKLVDVSEEEDRRARLKLLCEADEARLRTLNGEPEEVVAPTKELWVQDLFALALASPKQEKLPLLEKVVDMAEKSQKDHAYRNHDDTEEIYPAALLSLALHSPKGKQAALLAKARAEYGDEEQEVWLERLLEFGKSTTDEDALAAIQEHVLQSCDPAKGTSANANNWFTRCNYLLRLAQNGNAAERAKLIHLAFEAQSQAIEQAILAHKLRTRDHILENTKQLYGELLAANPENGELWQAWGNFQATGFRFGLSRRLDITEPEIDDAFANAAKFLPNSPQVYTDWGNAIRADTNARFIEEDLKEKIYATYQQALKIDPHFLPALQSVADFARDDLENCRNCDQPKKLAILRDTSEKIVKITPNSAQAWHDLGWGHSGLALLTTEDSAAKQAEEAIKALTKATKIDPAYAHNSKTWANALLVLAINTADEKEQNKLFEQAAFRYGPENITPGTLSRNWTNLMFNYARTFPAADNEALWRRIAHECAILLKSPKAAKDLYLWYIWCSSLDALGMRAAEREDRANALKLFDLAVEKISICASLTTNNFEHAESLWQWGNLLQKKAKLLTGEERKKTLAEAFDKYNQSITVDTSQKFYDSWLDLGWGLFEQYQEMQKNAGASQELKDMLNEAEEKFAKGMEICAKYTNPNRYAYRMAQIQACKGDEEKTRAFLEKAITSNKLPANHNPQDTPAFAPYKDTAWFKALLAQIAAPEQPGAKTENVNKP